MTRRFIFLLLALGVALTHASSYGAEAMPCGAGSAKSGASYSVIGTEVYLRDAPRPDAGKLVNQKATDILKKTQYRVVDNSTTVTEECTQGGWSRVHVTAPEWLSATHMGWVPSNVLRKPQSDASGKRIFTEADFIWDKKIAPYKKYIVAGVNKVYRENARCHDIDPASAYLSPSKGTPSNPVFFVTCGSGAGAFNAYFSKSDVENGSKLLAVQNVDRSKAVALCEDYARGHAAHPSTVDFSRVLDLVISEHPNGRTSVRSTFTAKNNSNLQLKYNIQCLVDSTGLVDANILEAAR
jgi:hypothetical protein